MDEHSRTDTDGRLSPKDFDMSRPEVAAVFRARGPKDAAPAVGWHPAMFWHSPDDTAVVIHTTLGADGRPVIDRMIIAAPNITATTLRQLRMGQIGTTALRGEPEKGQAYARLGKAVDSVIPPDYDYSREPAPYTPTRRKPLSRPDGTDPEGFLRRVAEAYNDAVNQTSTPAKWLAAEAGVPVATVHRWIRDARKAGLLPPARRGRAG